MYLALSGSHHIAPQQGNKWILPLVMMFMMMDLLKLTQPIMKRYISDGLDDPTACN